MQDVQRFRDHALFSGLTDEETERIWKCFHFTVRRYRKNEYILMEGDEVRQIGMIVTGDILMEKEDMSGGGCFFIKLQAGELFGDMFIGEHIHKSTVNYRALSECEVVLFSYRAIWEEHAHLSCHFSDGGVKRENETFRQVCECHLRFVENLTGMLAIKTRRLLAKVEILSAASLRKRILTFLRIMGERQGQTDRDKMEYTVELPFHKTELADFLCVNRSALMRELSNMRKEGILWYEGNRYTFNK